MEGEMGRDRLREKRVQKQLGCVTGFFQIFGRQHALNGKRLNRAPVMDYSPELERSVQSSSVSMDFDGLDGKGSCLSPLSIKSSGTKRCPQTPEATPPVKTPPSATGYEFKEMSRSTWKFRESPRLSLDSRAIVHGSISGRDDGVETQRKSTSVIARLMGLETLPELDISDKILNSELRRSASESRVSNDLFTSRVTDKIDSCPKKSEVSRSENAKSSNCNAVLDNVVTKKITEHNRKPQQRRICSYESADVYPEETRRLTSYGEVERKLKSRGVNIDEPLMDLDTLKLVLEALQLKGLLRKTEQVPKPSRRPQNESPPRHNPRSPRKLNPSSPTMPRKAEEQRRVTPVRDERSRSSRKIKPMLKTGTKLEVSEPPSMSEISLSDAESMKDKRSVLERCDMLLHSIAEFNNMSKLHQQEGQPSPVSVLDSSYYHDDSSSSPSPVMKRSMVFSDDMQTEPLIPAAPDDPDFIFISDILRLESRPLNESGILTNLKDLRRSNTRNTISNKISKLQSKLVFDIATELIKKHTHGHLPDWKTISLSNPPPITLIWSEFKKLRDQKPDQEDLIELTRTLLHKDLSNDSWSEHHAETKETVIDVERQIFRDLIEDTIRDLGRQSAFPSQPSFCKKLVF